MIRILAATAVATAPSAVMAAVDTQTGWVAWNNTHRITDKWSVVTDLQVRSADDWDGVRNALVRPSLAYAVNGKVTASLGYLFNRTFNPDAPDTTEQRIWQQLSISQPLPRVQLTHRIRLEQRFIERVARPDVQAVRIRYQLRAQIPLRAADGTPFVHGSYLATHGEWMGHLSGEKDLNGQTFDQFRAYAGAGWRFSRKADVEVGYQLQYLNGRTTDTRNHIVLISASTRF